MCISVHRIFGFSQTNNNSHLGFFAVIKIIKSILVMYINAPLIVRGSIKKIT